MSTLDRMTWTVDEADLLEVSPPGTPPPPCPPPLPPAR